VPLLLGLVTARWPNFPPADRGRNHGPGNCLHPAKRAGEPMWPAWIALRFVSAGIGDCRFTTPTRCHFLPIAKAVEKSLGSESRGDAPEQAGIARHACSCAYYYPGPQGRKWMESSTGGCKRPASVATFYPLASLPGARLRPGPLPAPLARGRDDGLGKRLSGYGPRRPGGVEKVGDGQSGELIPEHQEM